MNERVLKSVAAVGDLFAGLAIFTGLAGYFYSKGYRAALSSEAADALGTTAVPVVWLALPAIAAIWAAHRIRLHDLPAQRNRLWQVLAHGIYGRRPGA